jgi:hypothetical protein
MQWRSPMQSDANPHCVRLYRNLDTDDHSDTDEQVQPWASMHSDALSVGGWGFVHFNSRLMACNISTIRSIV